MLYCEQHETDAWLESLDPKCRLEAVIAGYSPPLSNRSIPTGDESYTLVGLFIDHAPHEVIIARPQPPSPLLTSLKQHILQMSNATIFPKPCEPTSPSPYRSQSPDTICCGMFTVARPVEVYV